MSRGPQKSTGAQGRRLQPPGDMARATRRRNQLARKARIRRQRLLIGSVVGVIALCGALVAAALSGRLPFAFFKRATKAPAGAVALPARAAATSKEATADVAMPVYTITFDVSETPGANVTPEKLTLPVGSAPDKLPYASLEDKRFTGWYTGPQNDEQATCVDNSTLSLISTSTATTLYARFEASPQGVDYKVRGLPVLMYHDFYDPAQGKPKNSLYPADCLSIKTFDDQLAWLRENDYYFPDWTEVQAFTQGKILLPKESIVLTADDGSANFFKLAIPEVERYQAHITGFLIGDRIASDGIDLASYDPRYVTFESHSYGLHVGNSKGDGLITTISEDKIKADIEAEARVIGPNSVFCYPFGRRGRDYSKREEELLADNGYSLAFTVSPGRVYPGLNPMALPRMRVSAPCTMETFRALAR